MQHKREKEYYNVIKQKLEELFREKGADAYLEITANRTFSNEIKKRIPPNRDIIFSFLKKAAPDITGIVKINEGERFFAVEIKKDELKLDDIYQLKKYADLFETKYAFLVSMKPLPTEMKRLLESTLLLGKLSYDQLVFALAQFDWVNQKFEEWYEKNPFESF